MAKLNVAIADDNERILTMLDEVLTADDDITVVGQLEMESRHTR